MTVAAEHALLHPLDELHRLAGLALPRGGEAPPADLPQPFRRLLVHHRDMTPTLEAYAGEPMALRVLQRERHNGSLLRRVLLLGQRSRRVYEFGASRIVLGALPAEVQRLVLAADVPLGAILRDHGVAHSGRPLAYLRLAADAATARAFDIPAGTTLYGRRNILVDAGGQTLADVLELLPPDLREGD